METSAPMCGHTGASAFSSSRTDESIGTRLEVYPAGSGTAFALRHRHRLARPGRGNHGPFVAAARSVYLVMHVVKCEAPCLDRIGNELVASDSLHLTPTGSKYLIDRIGPALLHDLKRS